MSYEGMIDHCSYTHNLSSCEIKALIVFSDFNFTTAQVVCITAIINHVFISFSAIQIYGLSYIHLKTLLVDVLF